MKTTDFFITLLVDQNTMTIEKIAVHFNQLAQQENWFEIQNELLVDTLRSLELPS